MSDTWRSFPLSDYLSQAFAGEWGRNPDPMNCVVYRSTDIDDVGNITGTGAERNLPLDKILRKQLVEGDILLEASGGGPDKPVGRSAIVDGIRASSPSTCSNFFRVLRPNKQKVDPKFLNHKLVWRYRQPEMLFFQQQTTGIINLKIKDFLAAPLSVPADKEVQSKIAEILDTLDVAIRGTEAVVAKLKAMKQGLLHDLLTRGIDADGDLRPPQPEAPHLYKKTPLGWLPKEWNTSRLPGLAQSKRPVIKTGPFGSSLKGEHWRETGRPVITIGSFGESGFIENELLFIDERKAKRMIEYEVQSGDLVFSRVADVGRSLVVEESEADWIMSSNLMRISVDRKKLLPSLLHVQLRHSVRLRKRMSQLVNSAGRDVANSAVLLALDIAVPPEHEQIEIENAIICNDEKLVREEQQLDKLRLQKSGLMDDLLTGRTPVTALL